MIRFLFCLMAGLVLAGSALAEGSREVLVSGTTGKVQYQRGGQGDWLPIESGQILSQSDVVKTGEDATCSLIFKGMSNTAVDVRPNSEMALKTVVDSQSGDDTELDLAVGAVLVKAEKLKGDSAFEVRTPNSIVGIRGTEFEVKVD